MEERGSQAQKRHKVLNKNFRNKKEKGILKEKANKHTLIYIRLCFICDIGYWKMMRINTTL